MTGLAAAPSFSVSATSYDFGTVGTGFSLARAVATVKNTGSLQVSNPRVTISGANGADFTTDGTCGSVSSLSPGSTCTPGIYFMPQSVGAKSAIVTISADGGVSQTVQVTGQAAKVGLSMTPLSLNYGNVIVGQPSTKTVSFTNTGDVTLGPLRAIFAATTTGYFQYDTTCPLFNPNSVTSGWSVAPGQTCTFSLLVAPEKLDVTQNSFTFGLQPSDGFTSPQLNVTRQTVFYSVTGIAPLTLNPVSLDLGSVVLGQGSDGNVTLTNAATYNAKLGGAIGGGNAADFSYASGCPAVIPAGTSCTLRIHFAPSASGARAASLTLTPASTSPYAGLAFIAPQTITLSGNGIGDFVIGTTSASSSVAAGQAATYQLFVGTSTGLQGAVALSCSNLPQYASCSFSPASVAPGSASTAVTLTISTQQTATASLRQSVTHPFGRAWYQVSSASLFALCLCGMRLGRAVAMRTLRLCAMLMVGSTLLLFTTGCGGSTGSSGGSAGGSGGGTTYVTRTTASGTYAIQVNGMGGGATHATTVNLIVQ